MGVASSRGRDEMASGAAESSAKRAKKEKEDPLVRRREELILEVARVAMKAQGNKAMREATESLMQALRATCTELEAKNHDELLKKLPDELWEKIVDENIEQNDLLALASTCRFFREKQEDLGWELKTKVELYRYRRLDERKSGQKLSHSLGWFRWVCDNWEILPGFEWRKWIRVKGAVYEGDLVNCAALQGSVEILRWLVEEKGCELNKDTGLWAGHGGCVEVLKYLKVKGYEFTVDVSDRAARGGHLKALKFLRGLDPPCPWDSRLCGGAAQGGHLEVLKWLRAQKPPCPWSAGTCEEAARIGNLDVLKWARDQDPPCPWEERVCAAAAWKGHLDVLKFLRAQDPPCPWSEGTCTGAADGGQLEVLQWARSQDPPCPWNLETCSYAVYEGQLEALKWLRAQNPPCPWSRYTCRELASENGYDHIVDWVDQQEEKSDDGDEVLVGDFWGE
ncbi:ANK_REP_REGION domain-containing protein [Chloropicon roscoffensis]|uniref:ANK_REP_REGION domain-containing protein n=1 Tax=Chloropicon roscoffensis TaxID=1461544 RepID=A0AAX4P8N9_9CHLO